VATVRVNGIDLYYEERGKGDPVILIPGLGGVGASWGPQISLLAEAFRTITVDHPGTGKSSVPNTGYTIAQHAGDIAGLLRALKATPAHIIGASTGGAIGQVMALDYTDTVRSLVLVGTWGRADTRFRRLFEFRKRVLLELGPEAAMHLALLLLYSPAYYRAHSEVWQTFVQSLKVAAPDSSIAAKRIDMIIAHDTLGRLKDIKQPTAIVVGELDVVTAPYLSEELRQHIRHSELHLIPGAGHTVYVEKPDVFFQIVRGFLGKLSAV
jgi:aminoacrylate hydrolase